jgi:hypothetical protein
MKEGWEIIWCPLCGEDIHRHHAAPILSRVSVSSRSSSQQTRSAFAGMVEAANALHEELVRAAEKACADHFNARHRLRYRAWKRWRRNWLLTYRFPRRPRRDSVEDTILEPLKFLK